MAGADLPSFHGIIGRSAAMLALFSRIAQVAPLRVPVLIQGESGTGKELVATAIQRLSTRSGRPFERVNCADFTPELLRSELFGHERGAFSGAITRKVGLLSMVDGGTVFLDEVGELVAEARAMMLRFLQAGEGRPVGAVRNPRFDVRVISATHRDLAAAVRQGTFREDLYYRLRRGRLKVPPLRQRREDIPLLVEHFRRRLNESEGLSVAGVTPEAFTRLENHHWPGNVRELENLARRLAALYPQEVIGEALIETELNAGVAPALARTVTGDEGRGYSVAAGQIAGDEFGGAIERAIADLFRSFGASIPQGGLYHRVLHDLEAPLIAATLALTRGNQIRAAQVLGLNRNTLRKKIRDLNLRSVSSFR